MRGRWLDMDGWWVDEWMSGWRWGRCGWDLLVLGRGWIVVARSDSSKVGCIGA